MNPWLDIYYTDGFGGLRIHEDYINDLKTGTIRIIPRINETVALKGKYWTVKEVIHSPTVPSVEIIVGEAK